MKLLTILVGFAISSNTCEEGWTVLGPDSGEVGYNSCFRLTCVTSLSLILDWFEAKSACEAENGWLAHVQFDSMNSKIYALAMEDGTMDPYRPDIWIGGSDHGVDKSWIDTNGTPLTYYNWWTEPALHPNPDFSTVGPGSTEPEPYRYHCGGSSTNSYPGCCIYIGNLPLEQLETGEWIRGHRWRAGQCHNPFWSKCYACEKDIDECANGSHNCHNDATCTNIIASFTCECKPGFIGDGTSCQDVNECTLNTHTCHADATCTNTSGGYNCNCNPNYGGDGFNCIRKTCDDGWTKTGPYPEEVLNTMWGNLLETIPESGTLETCLRVNCHQSDWQNRKSWHDAQAACEAENGWLAIQKYPSLDAEILQKSGNRETWIGATDQAVEGVWMDSRGRPVTFTDWWNYGGALYEPDNQGGNQDCVSVDHLAIGLLEGSWFHASRWRDQDCADQLICYACQKGNNLRPK